MTELKKLVGSEKQIKWATKIRAGLMDPLEKDINRRKKELENENLSEIRRSKFEKTLKKWEDKLAKIYSCDSSSVFIDGIDNFDI